MIKRRAFTLVELLVVIAIIGLLSTVAVVALGSARVNARNQTRKANLVQISKALELYFNDNGGYPDTAGAWRGACASYGANPNVGAGAWIPNFASYMPILPRDPNTNIVNLSSSLATCRDTAGQNCYIYRGSVSSYKLLAHCIPEGTMLASDPFFDPVRSGHAWQVSTPDVRTTW